MGCMHRKMHPPISKIQNHLSDGVSETQIIKPWMHRSITKVQGCFYDENLPAPRWGRTAIQMPHIIQPNSSFRASLMRRFEKAVLYPCQRRVFVSGASVRSRCCGLRRSFPLPLLRFSGRVSTMEYGISHSFEEESLEAKARWFLEKPLEDRLREAFDGMILYRGLCTSEHPDDRSSFKTVRVLEQKRG